MSFGNKMIVASCPLRVSFLGGSTDLEDFIEEYGYGEVINFPINLYTYVSINKRYDGKFLIQYSKTESVDKISDIQNELVRVVLEYFKINTPITVALNADIPSHGSGLASSSSFIISMIKATSIFKGVKLDDYELCKLALQLERKFNPLVGRQDAFGCGLKGFKHLSFKKDGGILINPFDCNYFDNHNLFLIPISKNGRKSTDVLKSLKLNGRESILNIVNDGVSYLKSRDFSNFNQLILETWEEKKKTSNLISNSDVMDMEKSIKNTQFPIYYKLCGAGGGGYMLLIKEKNKKNHLDLLDKKYYININIDNRGIKSWELN
jgi:D-glycero-alpha-D-manno-heptose-7-phosphate kinase